MLDLPLEYALIEFKDAKFSGRIIPELLHLAERGIVRFVDIAVIHRRRTVVRAPSNSTISTPRPTSCSSP
jgi:hypothetical protein